MDDQDDLRILGIDPGLNVTGYGLIRITRRGPQVVEAGVLRGPAHETMGARLLAIYRAAQEVLRVLRPSIVALEELYSHYDRPRTAILMGHARGVICLAAAEASLPIHDYAATQVKSMLTGSGRASKSQVQQAVQRELHLPQIPEPSDVADVLAIALCHHYLAGRRVA